MTDHTPVINEDVDWAFQENKFDLFSNRSLLKAGIRKSKRGWPLLIWGAVSVSKQALVK